MAILHIDFNSYFATVEQQANPRLRGKPIGVTGGDRLTRTVLSTASVEAKKLGVKTGMQIWEAKKICPGLIIVPGDSDKYLECSKRFWNILKDYSPYVEIFSIDEAFLELVELVATGPASSISRRPSSLVTTSLRAGAGMPFSLSPVDIALEIKQHIQAEIGEWITCSIGISYNKLMAKLAGSLKKPDGLVVIANEEEAMIVLDQVALDDICGIGSRIKKRLFSLGIRDFKTLRQIPKECLLASFKSYGEVLYNMARGLDHSLVVPFYDKEEVKSIGHRHTLNKDIWEAQEIRYNLLKFSEMVAFRLRDKRMVGKTVSCWYRASLHTHLRGVAGGGMQKSLGHFTCDGLQIAQAAWQIFLNIWDKNPIRMVGISISNLKSSTPANLSFLEEDKRREKILQALDKVNHKFGDFTLQRGSLLKTQKMERKPNPFLSDRKFKLS